AELGVGRFFWVQIRIAEGYVLTLSADGADAVMQLVECWCFVSLANAAFHGPAIGRVPHEIGARADVATECFVIFIASTQGERQVVAQTPFIFYEQRPGFLLEVFSCNTVSH